MIDTISLSTIALHKSPAKVHQFGCETILQETVNYSGGFFM